MLVHGERLLRGESPGELRGPAVPEGDQVGSQLLVAGNAFECSGHRLDVARVAVFGSFSVDLGQAPRASGDHGHAGHHRLEPRQTEALAERDEHVGERGFVEGRELRLGQRPAEDDVSLDPAVSGPLLQRGFELLVVARENELEVSRDAAPERGECIDQSGQVLVGIRRADVEEEGSRDPLAIEHACDRQRPFPARRPPRRSR